MMRCFAYILFLAMTAPARPGTSVEHAVFLGEGVMVLSQAASVTGIVTDAKGNVYVAGSTAADDFAGGTLALSPNVGGVDVFVVKLDPLLNEVLYAVKIGGSGTDFATALTLDDAGAAYVAGFSRSTDWTPTVGDGSFAGTFVLKLDPSGAETEFVASIGGGRPHAIAVDTRGRTWIAGKGVVPTTPDAIRGESVNEVCSFSGTGLGGLLSFDCSDGFLVRLNPESGEVDYATLIGGMREDAVDAVAAAPDGGVFVGGATDSQDFPTDPIGPPEARSGGYVLHFSGDESPQLLASWRTGKVKGISITPSGDLAVSGAISGFSFLRHISIPGYQEVRLRRYREEFGLARLAWAADGSAVLWTPSPISGDHPRINVPIGFLSGLTEQGEVNLDSQLLSGIPDPIPAVGPDGSVYLFGETRSPFFGSAANAGRSSTLGGGRRGIAILRIAPAPSEDPLIYRIDNAAGLSDRVFSAAAPGVVLTIRGRGLGPDHGVAGLSTDLAGVRVLFDDTPAHLLWAEERQINLIAPWGLRPQCLSGAPNQVEDCLPSSVSRLVVERDGERFGFFDLAVGVAMPGVFTESATGQGQILALLEDGSRNSPSNPARAGEIITLYATGLGPMQPPGVNGGIQGNERVLVTPVLPVRATIARRTAEVVLASVRAGMLHGLFEVQVRVPDDLRAPGEFELHLYVGHGASQDLATVAIE